MSLFGSLQTASNTLQAMQIGLQVASNNISNANTEGYIRERVNYTPAPVQEFGSLQIGLGVQIDSITQVVDDFLGQQLRSAGADRASADLQNEAYKDLERLLGELSDNDLSTALTKFFGSIEDTLSLTAGEALSVRNLATLEGSRLAAEIQRVDERAKALRDSYDDQILSSVSLINEVAKEIQQLNIRVTQIEGGQASNSDAGALRTQRDNAVNELAELVDITVTEQPSGGLSVSIGGEFLIFEGQRREIRADIETDELGQPATRLMFTDTESELDLARGKIHGLTVARDEVVGGFRQDLDEFASTLIYEFNRVYTGGQGISGFNSLTSTNGVSDPEVALSEAGLAFPPTNGSFHLIVANADGGEPNTTVIDIKLLGNDDDTTLNDLAAQIDAVEGVSATVDSTGRLAIAADSADTEFYFGGATENDVYLGDTSGVLASLGINTFFTGSGSESISVNSELAGIENASKFAASNTGLGGGTGNAIALAALVDQPLEDLAGATLFEQYDQVVNELAQKSTVAGSVAEGLGVFEATLATEFQAVSGVNIDEEAINMIALQRIYQATARVISTIQEMLDTLIRI